MDCDEGRQVLYRDEYQHGGNGRRERSVVKGAIAGLAGGLAASAVMNLFQQAMRTAAASADSQDGPRDAHAASAASGGTDTHGAQSIQRTVDDEDAAMKMAEVASEVVTGKALTKEQKKVGGTFAHYAFGASMGALYGALAEMSPRTAAALGAPFGAAVWVGADEIAVPALGLSKGPREYPVSTHAQAFAAHLVYGVATDAVRRLVRRAL